MLLYEIKDGYSVPDWREKTCSIGREDEISPRKDCSQQIIELAMSVIVHVRDKLNYLKVCLHNVSLQLYA
jgi:hypothetical protein